MTGQTNQNERLLGLPEVMSTCGLKKSSIYALIGQGLFPKQIKVSKRKSVWASTHIQKWISDRMLQS